MAGGGGSTEVFQQDQASADNGQGAYTPPTTQAPADYYSSLTRPAGSVIRDAYMQALGREPESAGANYWANAAQRYGFTGQELAQSINTSGAPERVQSGYQSQFNPQSFNTQRVGTTPSYYNTNPVGVDYTNIFNPAARSVIQNQQTLTPQQQAAYLSDWQRDYSNTNRAATQAANAQRINTANAQWANYLAKQEAQKAPFNAEWYLQQNPDVAAAGVDPLTHYNTYGKNEGRLPGPSVKAKAGGQIGIRGIK